MIRVAFCQHYFYQYIGVMMLAAQLRRHRHQVELFVYDLTELYGAVKERRFDLVCFTMMSQDVEWVTLSAQRIKALDPSLPIVVGGAHTTFFSDFLRDHPEIDACCVGEGDEAIVEIAQAVEERRDFTRIRNLVARGSDGGIVQNPVRPLIEDLDALPFADRAIYEKYEYFRSQPVTSIIASRGCPYSCNFCFNHKYKALYRTARFRRRSPENIIAEIKAIQAGGTQINTLFFVDSTINTDEDWCVDLFQKYKREVDVSFQVNLAAGQINERVVLALAQTGRCRAVMFAVEVGNERIRNDVLRKKLSNADIARAARLLRERNINVYVYLMFGVPFETEETAKETIAFCQEIRPYFVKPALFAPYRELDITKLALDSGFLLPTDLDRLDDAKFSAVDSVMRLADINSIKRLFYLSIVLIQFPRLSSFLMLLVKLPLDFVLRKVFLVSYALQWRALAGMSLRRMLLELKYHRMES